MTSFTAFLPIFLIITIIIVLVTFFFAGILFFRNLLFLKDQDQQEYMISDPAIVIVVGVVGLIFSFLLCLISFLVDLVNQFFRMFGG